MIDVNRNNKEPLLFGKGIKYLRKCELWYDWDKEEELDLNLIGCSGNHKGYYLQEWPVEVYTKVEPIKFTKLDFLYCQNTYELIIHKKILPIFNKLCPNDFKTVKLTIVNVKKKIPYFCTKPLEGDFVNKDYYLIVVINRLDLLDREKSGWNPNYSWGVVKNGIHWKEDPPWGDHLLCRDTSMSGIFFHPKLAHEFEKQYKRGEIAFQSPNREYGK